MGQVPPSAWGDWRENHPHQSSFICKLSFAHIIHSISRLLAHLMKMLAASVGIIMAHGGTELNHELATMESAITTVPLHLLIPKASLGMPREMQPLLVWIHLLGELRRNISTEERGDRKNPENARAPLNLWSQWYDNGTAYTVNFKIPFQGPFTTVKASLQNSSPNCNLLNHDCIKTC